MSCHPCQQQYIDDGGERDEFIHALTKRYGSLHCLKKKEPFTTATLKSKESLRVDNLLIGLEGMMWKGGGEFQNKNI